MLAREVRNLVDTGLLAGLLLIYALWSNSPTPWGYIATVVLITALVAPRPTTGSPNDRISRPRVLWLLLTAAGSALLLTGWAGLGLSWLLPLALWPMMAGMRVFVSKRIAIVVRNAQVSKWSAATSVFAPAGTWAAEAVLVGGAIWLLGNYASSWSSSAAVASGGAITWLGARIFAGWLARRTSRLDRFSLLACWSVLGVALFTGAPTSNAARAGVATTGLLGAGLLLLHLRLRRFGTSDFERGNEGWRLAALLAVSLVLLRGFATPELHGTGDARWYGVMLADMVAQTRAGVFPVFFGQSPFQFNGAIYPLRVAPAFHYLGASLDFLTLHSLGVFALQNCLLTLIGIVATILAYFAFADLSRRPALAVVLAIAFVACPGVIGIVYNTDLYMSWTTLPGLVLAFWAAAKSFTTPSFRTMIVLGAATGWLWWGHTPIALWATIVLGSSQLVRVALTIHKIRSELSSVFCGAIAFLLIAAYPLGSVLLYPPEAGINASDFQRAAPGTIFHFLREVFPRVLLPVSANGRELSDFQLGYALWVAVGLLGIRLFRRSSAFGWIAFAWVSSLVLLLTPIPDVNSALWRLVPATVRDITGNWVMNRLYVILALTSLTGLAVCCARTSEAAVAIEGVPRGRRWVSFLIVAILSGWSVREAAKFAHGSDLLRWRGSAESFLRTENVQITRFAYLVYPNLPSYFSHGVMDPEFEFRLLDSDGRTVRLDRIRHQPTGAPIARLSLEPKTEAGRTVYEANQPFVLHPRERYLAVCSFSDDLPAGVLQFLGPEQMREYALPAYGESRSFGVGGEHTPMLSLWTSSSVPEPIRAHFFPDDPTLAARLSAPVTISVYSAKDAPPIARITGWHPFAVETGADAAGWLETPRMFLSGYAATVNGHPAEVRKSPDGLLAVSVPSGESTIEILWKAPLGLLLLFWMSFIAVIVGVGLVLPLLIGFGVEPSTRGNA